MKNCFDIPYGSTVAYEDYDKLVMKNAMVIDIMGNVAAFADLQPINIAAIQSEAEDFGVLLAIGEQEQSMARQSGHAIKLQYFNDPVRRTYTTPEQSEALETLAAVDMDKASELGAHFVEESTDVLPALWHSEIAIVKTGLLFREGIRRQSYDQAVILLGEQIRGHHEQAHREWNARIRSNLSDMGYDTANIPKPELDEQRRAQEMHDVAPKWHEMYVRAETMQVADLSSEQFAVAVAKAALSKSST